MLIKRYRPILIFCLFPSLSGCATLEKKPQPSQESPLGAHIRATNEGTKTDFEGPLERPYKADAPFSLPWFQNQVKEAESDAKKRGRPLFVFTWATWCHSCLSLESDVLSHPQMKEHMAHFTWLRLDIDSQEAASFLERFPQIASPTLWVLSPTGQALLRWTGTLSLEELKELLEDSLLVEKGDPKGLMARLLKATSLEAEGQWKEAESLYRELLRDADDSWPKRPRTLKSLMFLLTSQQENEAALALAMEEWPKLKKGDMGRQDLWIGAINAALRVRPKLEDLEGRLAPFLEAFPSLLEDNSILRDRKSDLFLTLRKIYSASGKTEEEDRLMKHWRSFLENTRRDALGIKERAVYDSHMTTVLMYFKAYDEARSLLQASQKHAPQDHLPLYLEAQVLLQMKRPQKSLEKLLEASQKASSATKVRYLAKAGDLALSLEQAEKANTLFQEALSLAQSLPSSQQPKALMSELDEKTKSQHTE